MQCVQPQLIRIWHFQRVLSHRPPRASQLGHLELQQQECALLPLLLRQHLLRRLHLKLHQTILQIRTPLPRRLLAEEKRNESVRDSIILVFDDVHAHAGLWGKVHLSHLHSRQLEPPFPIFLGILLVMSTTCARTSYFCASLPLTRA